ncbi:molecular chaperone [Altericroceibacterium endophyticum]|uniref:Fimbria/pilus periplasmic chaperone n=1 Tax=Altericroceibacterium endophyticum TaxID=1808508 RepID=A0A6I4T218_9SPHN|nr:fimbria/pilus periplasmic chaperone [Altericroceibacterium endophyticum]MXO64143.1 fimbria/pilus periplasmic chaperone [Altericroceibacterium endophyticum]
MQVSPVRVTIDQPSEVVWLSNASPEPLSAQIRIFSWTQDGGEESLRATDDLVASPPIMDIGAGERQLVRLIPLAASVMQASPSKVACETAFRMIVDELPPERDARAVPRAGVRYRLRYSIPVFQPASSCPQEITPELTFTWEREGEDLMLKVANIGHRHAQLGRAILRDANGDVNILSEGLWGYVLPGSAMSFAVPSLPDPRSLSGTLEIMVNGTEERHLLQSSAADS